MAGQTAYPTVFTVRLEVALAGAGELDCLPRPT
jgi:hypothetical protein